MNSAFSRAWRESVLLRLLPYLVWVWLVMAFFGAVHLSWAHGVCGLFPASRTADGVSCSVLVRWLP